MRDWKDSDLKALFLEMRERDRESATRFERDWELARSRQAATRRTSFRYVVATVSVIVLALSTTVVVRIGRPPSPKPQPSADGQELGGGLRDLLDRYPSGPPRSVPPRLTPKPGSGIDAGRVRAIKRLRPSITARHRSHDSKAYQDQQIISSWRSPTDFLLKSPADDMLRTVPNIRDSLVKIDGR